MTIQIVVNGSRAILKPNPNAKTITFLDRWMSHGYLATLGQQGSNYLLQKVVYDLEKVPFSKVQEVADNIDKQKFSCPVCEKMAEEREAEEGSNVQEQPPITERIKEAAEASKSVPVDEEEEKERLKKAAVKQLIGILDEALLLKMMKGF
ncbi:MAG: hypothetical protein H8D26_08245 [Methanomicrobia archaeon]|nr:hypothetical protein [Methanomicrobia archaeon]